jgi:hypothetical protein
MSWRDMLPCRGPMEADRSDITLTSVTSVTTPTGSRHRFLAIDQQPREVMIPLKAPRFRERDELKEDEAIKALRELAKLLAVAYRRQRAICQVADDAPCAEPPQELAFSCATSVHGVVI